jgi:hypothetical protein
VLAETGSIVRIFSHGRRAAKVRVNLFWFNDEQWARLLVLAGIGPSGRRGVASYGYRMPEGDLGSRTSLQVSESVGPFMTRYCAVYCKVLVVIAIQGEGVFV